MEAATPEQAESFLDIVSEIPAFQEGPVLTPVPDSNAPETFQDIMREVVPPRIPFARQLEQEQYEQFGDLTEDEFDEELAKIEEAHHRMGLSYQDIVKGDLHNINVDKDRSILEAIDHNVGIFKGLRQTDKAIHRTAKTYGYNFFLGDQEAKDISKQEHIEAGQTNQQLMMDAGRVKKILATTLDIEVQIESGLKDAFKSAAAGTVIPGIGTAGGAFLGYTQNIFFDNFGASLISKEESGMHQDTAVVSAMAESAIITAMETAVLGYAIKFVPGAHKVISKLSKGVVEKVVSKTLLQVPVNATKVATAETATELGQLVVEELINNMAITRSNELIGGDLQTSTAAEVFDKSIEMLKTVGPAMFLIGGAGPAASYTAGTISKNIRDSVKAEDAAELSAREAEFAEEGASVDDELRDVNGAVVDLDATVPVSEGETVVNEAGEQQPAVPITPVEEAMFSTGYKASMVTDQQFEDMVFGSEQVVNGIIEQDLKVADAAGSTYGDFISNVRANLPRKQAKVVEGMLDARARVTGRTKEQFVEDHKLKFKQAEGTEFGSVDFIKDGETIIKAFQNTNLKDVTHEIGHVFRKDMNATELSQAESAFGVKDGNWTVEQEESFAEGFVDYMATGKAPSKGLTGIYEKLKLWIGNLLKTNKAQGVQVSPEVEAVYETMLKSEIGKDYVHKIAAIQKSDQTLYSQRGGKKIADEVSNIRHLERATENIVQEVEAVKKHLLNLVRAAKTAHRAGNMEGYNRAKAQYKATIERAKNRSAMSKSRSKIVKEIRRTAKLLKPRIVKGKPRGRYVASHQKQADILASAMSLKVKQAQEIIENLGPATDISDFDMLKRQLIELRANQNKMDEGTLVDILTQMKGFIEDGRDLRSAKIQKWQNRVEKTQLRIKDSLETIALRKGLDPNMIDAYDRQAGKLTKISNSIIQFAVLDFHGYMEMLDMGLKTKLGEGAAQLFTETLDSENQSNAGRIKHNTTTILKAAEIFGITGKDQEQTIGRMESEFAKEERKGRVFNVKYYKLDKEGNATNEFRDMEYSKAELRNLYMELQNDRVRQAWEKDGLNNAGIRSIREQLTDKDIDFINYQLNFYKEYFTPINKAYEDRYETSLKMEDKYSPIIRDLNESTQEGAINDILAEIGGSPKSDASSNSFINRINSDVLTVRQSDVGKMNHYIRQMEHFKAFSQKVRELQSMFRDKELRQEIKNVYGRNFMNNIDVLITNIARNGAYSGEMTAFDRGVKQIRGNLTRGLIGGKVLATVKQMTSAVAYIQKMPAKDYVAGLKEFLKNPKENMKELRELSLFIQNRRETIDRDISMLTNSSEFNDFIGKKLPASFNRMVMMFVKAGDVGAIYAGGWVYYKHLLTQENPKTGKIYTQKEAVREMEIVSRNTQQSSELGSLTLAQQGNEFMRLLTMFTSSPRQYTQQAYLAWQGLLHDKITPQELAKTTAIYFVALPTLFQTVALGGVDDEDDVRSVLAANVSSPIKAIPLANLVGSYIVSDIVEGHTYGRGMSEITLLSPVSSFYKGGKKVAKELTSENISYDDTLDGLSRMSAILELGGIPGRAGTRVLIGAGDILSGKPIQGLQEAMGVSPYQARK